MNVLVTGSNGFIGRHVCRYLKAKGNDVTGLGRRKDAVCPVDAYLCCDLGTDDLSGIYHSMQTGKLDAVVHLAADMRKEPYGMEVVANNCVGTQKVLEFCKEEEIPVFVQLSSLPVIGKPMLHPITETHPLAPPTIYHVTKVAEELLADYADRRHGIRCISFRISAPIGIGMNPNTIFPVFVTNAVYGRDLVLAGKGSRKQTYIHANDIAQAVDLALVTEKAHGVYHLSSFHYLSNLELAQACVNELHSKSKIVFSGKTDPEEDYDWHVSIERAQKDFGYVPKISMEQAILEYANSLDGWE